MPCLVHCLKPILGRGIVCLASRSQESFLLRGGGKAREEKRRRASGGRGGQRRIGAARSCLSSHVFAHTHSFVRRQRCSTCDANPGPTTHLVRWAPGLVYGSCVPHCIAHTRALVHTAQQRLSQLAPTSVRTGRIISLRSSKNLCIM